MAGSASRWFTRYKTVISPGTNWARYGTTNALPLSQTANRDQRGLCCPQLLGCSMCITLKQKERQNQTYNGGRCNNRSIQTGCLVKWFDGNTADSTLLANAVSWYFCRALMTVESVEQSLLLSNTARYTAESLPLRTVSFGSAQTFVHQSLLNFNPDLNSFN